jgi:hypothetical protein
MVRRASHSVLLLSPATSTNSTATITYYLDPTWATVVPSGTTLAVLEGDTNALNLIDLSGATPVKTAYTTPVVMAPGVTSGASFAAVSASQWVLGNQYGVLLDGESLATTPRYFGFGHVFSIAGGTGHFAISIASGTILYFNASTLGGIS